MSQQKTIEEIARRPLPDDPAEPEYFHPTEKNKAEGNWAVVFERLDDDGAPDVASTTHIIPVFDKRIHAIRGNCSCSPAYDPGKDLWTHRLTQ